MTQRSIEDKIALEVAKRHRAPQGHIQMTATEFVAEVKELLATLQREAEPVAEFVEDVAAIGGARFRLLKPLKVGSKLFLHPPLPVEQAGAVPEGWKLVPLEPTREMMIAGEAESDSETATYESVFTAMLAAAPQPPKGE